MFNDSYEAKKNKEKLILNLSIRNTEIQQGLFSLTRWVAVGTLIAAFYYLMEIFLEIAKHHSSSIGIDSLTSIFLFVAGMLVGGYLLLIAAEIISRLKSKKP